MWQSLIAGALGIWLKSLFKNTNLFSSHADYLKNHSMKKNCWDIILQLKIEQLMYCFCFKDLVCVKNWLLVQFSRNSTVLQYSTVFTVQYSFHSTVQFSQYSTVFTIQYSFYSTVQFLQYYTVFYSTVQFSLHAVYVQIILCII